ncbi:MAG: AmmeMemoRadiSam system radical SAM enzyme [Armatimonadetes bacterium]|nr:AmmeMemoRadiSam system radical SAM enzyme [Armatimonadota bacterium]
MTEARYWKPASEHRVDCYLCSRRCRIGEGQMGFCSVRANRGGKLYSLVYGRPCAVNVDPVEKKPLFHFLPGTEILSIGTVGCNLDCRFCQNASLSRGDPASDRAASLSPAQVVQLALSRGCQSVAYTYNEPTVFAEYAEDVAALARQNGLRNAFVTNGYVTPEALPGVYANIDAANVDLKAFSEDFYRRWTQAELQPVLDTLVALHQRGVWIEITNLVIPTLNDFESESRRLCEWILENLGDRVPLHFTAFHPDHQLTDKPPPPQQTLTQLRDLAREVGLKYVYVGNVHDDAGSSTYCPECNELLVARSWHAVRQLHLAGDRCGHCGARADFLVAP